MDNLEPIAVQQTAENVEQTTEQTPREKTFTQTEVNNLIGNRLTRKEAQIRKEYEPYDSLIDMLKVATGKESVEDIEAGLRNFYQEKGVQIPQSKPKGDYSEKDIQILAKAEAEEIIRGGPDEVADELERLTKLGTEKMTSREKAVFKILAQNRQEAEQNRKLSQMGVPEDVYMGEEFRSFAADFTSNVPIEKRYEIFQKTQPQKEIKTPGSMKSGPTGDTGVKDFYSLEEARKFTKADFDKDPKLYEAVMKSMSKWK